MLACRITAQVQSLIQHEIRIARQIIERATQSKEASRLRRSEVLTHHRHRGISRLS